MDECPICLQVLYDNNEIIKLDCCIARYHKKCLHNWVLIKKDCPCCREKLTLLRNCKYYSCNIVSYIICGIYTIILLWTCCDIFIYTNTTDKWFWKLMIILFKGALILPINLYINRAVYNYICNRNFTIKIKKNNIKYILIETKSEV